MMDVRWALGEKEVQGEYNWGSYAEEKKRKKEIEEGLKLTKTNSQGPNFIVV